MFRHNGGAPKDARPSRAKLVFHRRPRAITRGGRWVRRRPIRAQDYNVEAIEFAQANIAAAVDITQELSAVKSPADVIELSSDARKQFEKLAEQTKELAEPAQKIALATAQPLKDFTEGLNRAQAICKRYFGNGRPISNAIPRPRTRRAFSRPP